MSGPQHICFYSKRCRWSEAFLKQLTATPFASEFKFVCVDPGADGKRPPLPEQVKQVPTLFIRGEDEPRINGDVMNWLAERNMMETKGPEQEDIEPYTIGEMGGAFTKSYTLFQGEDYEAPKGNFEFLNGAVSTGTRTASDYPEGGLGARAQGGNSKTKKEQLFDSQMENYMRERSSGMPAPVMRQ